MNPVLRTILGWVTIAAIIFAIGTYFLVMVLSVLLVSGTQLGADLAALYTRGLPPLGAFFIYFKISSIPISINLLAYVGFCIIVFAACFITGFRSRDSFMASLANLPRFGRVSRSSNWLVVMPLVSSGLLVIVVLVASILTISGVPSGMLCKPASCPSTAILFYDLAHAPIGEELAFRILTPLSLILPIRIVWRRFVTGEGPSKSSFLSIFGISFLSPDHAKTRAGYRSVASNGWQGVHWLEWPFMAISAVTFGLAHVQSGGGTDWGQGKVITAAISGAVLAFVFIAYGAFATILLHWFFDFYVEVLTLSFPLSVGLNLLIVGGIFVGLFLIGIFSIFVGTAWLGKRIVQRLSPTTYKLPEVGP
jgi:hypothetical protein